MSSSRRVVFSTIKHTFTNFKMNSTAKAHTLCKMPSSTCPVLCSALLALLSILVPIICQIFQFWSFLSQKVSKIESFTNILSDDNWYDFPQTLVTNYYFLLFVALALQLWQIFDRVLNEGQRGSCPLLSCHCLHRTALLTEHWSTQSFSETSIVSNKWKKVTINPL